MQPNLLLHVNDTRLTTLYDLYNTSQNQPLSITMKFSAALITLAAASVAVAAPAPAPCRSGYDIDCLPNGEYAMKRSILPNPVIPGRPWFAKAGLRREEGFEARSINPGKPQLGHNWIAPLGLKREEGLEARSINPGRPQIGHNWIAPLGLKREEDLDARSDVCSMLLGAPCNEKRANLDTVRWGQVEAFKRQEELEAREVEVCSMIMGMPCNSKRSINPGKPQIGHNWIAPLGLRDDLEARYSSRYIDSL